MKYLNAIKKGIEYITSKVLVLMFMVMLLLVIIQVLYRYVLHIPIPWAEELARYLFTWLIFLGASLTSAKDEHLAITVFRDLIPVKYREFIIIVIDTIILVFLYILMIKSIDLVGQVKSTKTPVLQISMAFPYMSILVGSASMFIHTLINIIGRMMKIVKPDSV
ncbi:TRAP transporter small permease [Pseudogracilibacillus auburnensis]|uniref:TRAP-type C4-dicarboxylate transport system permease small subunit n=2 Tax=Pseudogracilibacillus auburnensis TaxID=1494959 RepID=A0A2V3W3S9_9BACI|nr:TRAP transporter small permease [Pseudogracilibacillus auburnensis]MBO1001823.1 TRAP transporter small permease [Pseudogracilibacillus auburnensis]PXW83389.1 TRAP-type C4-dicarboxylate transport system permease small subunit [Pseudogracilibacillus auburnensis]